MKWLAVAQLAQFQNVLGICLFLVLLSPITLCRKSICWTQGSCYREEHEELAKQCWTLISIFHSRLHHLQSKGQPDRPFVMRMLWTGMKRFHSQPGRYKNQKTRKQTQTTQSWTLQGSKAASALTETMMVNRNKLFLLLRYYKTFWKLKDKWPGDAWAIDLVLDNAPHGGMIHSCTPSVTDGFKWFRQKKWGHAFKWTQR